MVSVLLPPSLAAAVGFVLMIGVLIFCFALFLPAAILKLIVPVRPVQERCTDTLFAIVRLWGDLNELVYRLLFPLQWEIEVDGLLDRNRSYLLVCNHQSWIDILLLVHLLRHRTAPVCFFLKRELLWVPIIGFACWAMDFPFMKRHSREAIERNPALREEDLRTTQLACERFRDRPITLINFVEGTRFSEAKRRERQSPFQHLLRPKSAGVSFALNAMGEQFAGIIDVTIGYRPTRQPILLSFLMGEQNQLRLHARVLPVPQELTAGNYQHDPLFRSRFQAWINGIWAQKDARLEKWGASLPAAVRPRPV